MIFRIPIDQQIEEFLCGTIDRFRPNRIITVERKGTALLRAYLEKPGFGAGNGLDWKDVISNELLQSGVDGSRRLTDPTLLDCERILILEDSIYKGKHISDTRNRLISLLPRTGIVIQTAAFIVHDKADVIPDFFYYAHLDDERYSFLRRQVIYYLQVQGNLLLDTEHLEVPIKLHCSLKEFVDSLCQLGDVVEFLCEGDHINLTLYEPQIPSEDEFWEKLPLGTSKVGSLKKVRIRERGRNEYGIIPIMFASIPAKLPDDWNHGLPECLRLTANNPDANFHVTGLFGGIQLIKGVFMALSGLIKNKKADLQLPGSGQPGDTLSHLKAMFPELNLDLLRSQVRDAVDTGIVRGLKHRERLHGGHFVDGRDFNLADLGRCLRTRILDSKDDFLYELHGITYDIATNAIESVPRAAISAALDKEIDNARVVPQDRRICFSDKICRVVRFFELDNEGEDQKTRIERNSTPNASKCRGIAMDALVVLCANTLGRRLSQQQKLCDKPNKPESLHDQDADKTIRFMSKIWKYLESSSAIRLTHLPVKLTLEAKHGDRTCLDTQKQPDILKVMRHQDSREHPQYVVFPNTDGEPWKPYFDVIPVVSPALVSRRVKDKIITEDDREISDAIGDILGILSKPQVIALGRHETPEGTLHAIVSELKRWQEWMEDLLSELKKTPLDQTQGRESALWQCVFQIWTFAEEAIKKSETDMDYYRSGLECLERYKPDVTDESRDRHHFIKATISKLQPVVDLIWKDRRVLFLTIHAHICFSFANYVVGVLTHMKLLKDFPERMLPSQAKTVTAYSELEYILSLNPASISLTHLYFSDLAKAVNSSHSPAYVLPQDPRSVWDQKCTFEDVFTSIYKTFEYIRNNFINPEIERYRVILVDSILQQVS